MLCEPRCGGCGPPAGGVPLLEPELLEEPDGLGVFFGSGGRALRKISRDKLIIYLIKLNCRRNKYRVTNDINLTRKNK